jgi:hypothetical protein
MVGHVPDREGCFAEDGTIFYTQIFTLCREIFAIRSIKEPAAAHLFQNFKNGKHGGPGIIACGIQCIAFDFDGNNIGLKGLIESEEFCFFCDFRIGVRRSNHQFINGFSIFEIGTGNVFYNTLQFSNRFRFRWGFTC